MSTVFPREKIKPPKNAYPPWLEARLRGENVAIPESVLEENRPKIEPWMTVTATPGKILGGDQNPPAKYVPPPMAVKHQPQIPVKFIVQNAYDKPISGYTIRANSENLVTNEKGEASTKVYQGHSIDFCTGLNGWTTPNGAKRRVRMNGMIPIAQTFPVNTPTTVILYPESGELNINGLPLTQSIIYTPP